MTFWQNWKNKKYPSSQPLKHNWFHPTEPRRCLLTHQSTFSHIQCTCPVYYLYLNVGFPCGSAGKESTCNSGFNPWVQSLVWEDPLEKGKATHSSILSWRIPWTVSMGSQSRTQLRDCHCTWMCYRNIGGTQGETNNRLLQFMESLRLKDPNLWGHLICIPGNQIPGECHPSAHAAQPWQQRVPDFSSFYLMIIFFFFQLIL